MQRLVFSSTELPAELDDRTRFALWREIYNARHGEFDFQYSDKAKFSMRSEFAVVGDLGLAQGSGTIVAAARRAQGAAADKHNDFILGFNRGPANAYTLQRGREVICAAAQATLALTGEAIDNRSDGDGQSRIGLCIPRARLMELVADADDLVARPIDQTAPALRHLLRYLDFVLTSQDLDDEPSLAAAHAATLLDLTALALGGGRDAAELARVGGLRAARAQEIVAEIRKDFANPAFSAEIVGARLGLSPRYVQELLQDTRFTFSERVLELRLQKARIMLGDPRHVRLRISDIAFACGFNEVSYFNRCFRRRFGASPTQYRS